MPDLRSPEAQAYRRLYNTAAWQRHRWSILVRDGFTCQSCGKLEANTSQLVADHKTPHRGNLELFWSDENLWTLCKPCHDRDKQSEERTGYSKAIGIDGWPTDERHPANGGNPASREGLGGLSHPAWFRAVYVPLTIVCGPPASGKTTYVARHKGHRDLVIDLDAIAMQAFGTRVMMLDKDRMMQCMKRRNELLGDLMWRQAKDAYSHAWLIVSEPIARKRQWWDDTVRPDSIVVLETPEPECIARAKADNGAARAATVASSIRDWWTSYTRRPNDVIVRPDSDNRSPAGIQP